MKKLTFSWGTGIFIALALFITGMAVVFYISSQQDRNLERIDYYADATRHQENIDQRQNFDALNQPLQVLIVEDMVVVTLPTVLAGQKIIGTINFYRPSDKKLDKTFSMNNQGNTTYRFPVSQFNKGRYIIKLVFNADSKGYLTEKELIIP
jgi:hypothetical protein